MKKKNTLFYTTREEQHKLWIDFLANHAITERGLALRAELQQAVQRVLAKIAHEKKG